MTIKTPFKQLVPKIEIDLRGPQGNVFNLIKQAKLLAKQIDESEETITSRMMRYDYVNAIKVFDAYFGDYVTLLVDEDLAHQLQ